MNITFQTAVASLAGQTVETVHGYHDSAKSCDNKRHHRHASEYELMCQNNIRHILGATRAPQTSPLRLCNSLHVLG
jgi:hypothetical protein